MASPRQRLRRDQLALELEEKGYEWIKKEVASL